MHILVESIAHYEFARNSDCISGEAIWYSSSPAVVEKLQALNEKVFWLDGLNQPHVSNAAGEVAMEVTDWLTKSIKHLAVELRWPRLDLLVGMQVYRLLTTLIYKQATLITWIKATNGRRVIVGETALQFRPNAGLSIYAFDTVYAALWALGSSKDAEVLEVPAVDVASLAKDIDKPSFLTRIISLLDFSLAQVIYRVWKYALRGRWPGLRSATSIYLVNENNEAIREMLPFFVRSGFGIKKVTISREATAGEPEQQLPTALEISRAIESSAKLKDLDCSSDVVAAIVEMRLRETSRYWRPWIELARSEVRQLAVPAQRSLILSSTLKGYRDSALSAAASEQGIATAIVQHGVSAGLSKYHIPSKGYSEALSGAYYFVSTKAAQEFFAREAETYAIRQEVIGVPAQVRQIPNRRLQAWLTRISLGASKGERVVVYVAGTTQNNLKYQPHSLEDHEVHALHRTMADSVMPKIRGVPVIKLYPTRRYRDTDPMAGEFAAPFPVRTIKFGDFRFLRAGADIVILDSPLSTIGWAMGTGKPVFYLAHPSQPLLPDAQAAMRDALFFFDISAPGWPDRLLVSLNRPDDVIAADWQAKVRARERFLKEYVFGPEHAGRNGAEAVIMAARAGIQGHHADKSELAPQ